MNLENYWKILAKYSKNDCEFVVLSKGAIGIKDRSKFVLYNENGEVSVSQDIKEILYFFDDYYMARLPRGENGWSVTDLNNKHVIKLSEDVRLYKNGYQSSVSLGETFYGMMFSKSHPVSLGFNILKIVTGPDGFFAYQQKVRRYTYWHLCQMQAQKIVKSKPLAGAQDISFFANGSYIVYYKDQNIRVFNCRGLQIFSCNWKHTSFSKVGRNHFLAASGKKYKGIYSAYDGKLVLENRRIDLFWENGVYYVQEIGVYSPKQKDFFKLQEIYDEYVVGESLFCFNHRGGTFVIDTNLTLAELRKKAADELHKSSADEAYSAYLVRLLNLLY